jgi:AraC-like DNA-binding protein
MDRLVEFRESRHDVDVNLGLNPHILYPLSCRFLMIFYLKLMKATFEHISLPGPFGSVSHVEVDVPFFPFHWHYHPEFELTYIVRGRGTRWIGNHVEEYSSGDLILVGSNLPHCWYSDERRAPADGERAIVLQFPPQVVNDILLGLPECGSLRRLMQQSALGVKFSDVPAQIESAMHGVGARRGIDQIFRLLSLLDRLSETPCETLSTTGYRPLNDQKGEGRLEFVYQHIHKHFNRTLRLADVAKLAGMTPTSFSRYFKQVSGVSFIDHLTALRVQMATERLIHTRQTIAEIAYACGFNNLSNFNRVFTNRKQMTPGEYRRRYQPQ